ncbi:MAG: sugar ABC transporter permease [Oscillochloris sp.]|nr:sugar ABC transporter permease [Oscillochloris sp.]
MSSTSALRAAAGRRSVRSGTGLRVAKQGLSTERMVTDKPVARARKARGLASSRRRWRDLGRALPYLSPALLFLTAFTYLPFLRSIWLSFFITNPQGQISRFNGLKYYARIFNLDGSGRTEYLQSIVTTLSFSLLVVPLSIICALGLALLATLRVRGIGVFRTIFTSSIAISVASASVIWALIYSPNTRATQWLIDLLQLNAGSLLQHPHTALLAVAFMTTWTALGFNFIVTLAGIQAIPQDIFESARIDGASNWALFRHITLPLLTPTLLFLVVISTIQSFQAFTQFNVLIGNEGPASATDVFVFAIFTAFWKDNRYGFASAMAVVLFLVLLALTLIQYRLLDRRVHYQ